MNILDIMDSNEFWINTLTMRMYEQGPNERLMQHIKEKRDINTTLRVLLTHPQVLPEFKEVIKDARDIIDLVESTSPEAEKYNTMINRWEQYIIPHLRVKAWLGIP